MPPDGWKAVKIEGEKDWVEWHRVSDEPCGDCGLKAKESGCFYPGVTMQSHPHQV
jgi:hypothetical protein